MRYLRNWMSSALIYDVKNNKGCIQNFDWYCSSFLLKLLNEHILAHRDYTFEASWSTLSATFVTDNRISVLCCRASVIKKEVTSLEPGEDTHNHTQGVSFSVSLLKHKPVLFLCSIIDYWGCCAELLHEIVKGECVWFDHNVLLVLELHALTHVWDSLCRVDLANGLKLRWSYRGLCVGVRLWNNKRQWYKQILPDVLIYMYLW